MESSTFYVLDHYTEKLKNKSDKFSNNDSILRLAKYIDSLEKFENIMDNLEIVLAHRIEVYNTQINYLLTNEPSLFNGLDLFEKSTFISFLESSVKTNMFVIIKPYGNNTHIRNYQIKIDNNSKILICSEIVVKDISPLTLITKNLSN
jgi:hypothetical protein